MSWSQPYPWAIAVAFCAALAIWGKSPGRMIVHYLFKPLTTSVILAVAVLMVPHSAPRPWVLTALCLSLLGDIVLMLGDRWFKLGLLSFLLALAAWSMAFTAQIPFVPRQLLYLILPAAVSLLIVRSMWLHLGKLRWPVALYVATIATMTWRAFSRFDALDVSLAAWAWGCIGATLFITGDTLLARRKFVGKRGPYWIELGVYFAAQWCLVMSVC